MQDRIGKPILVLENIGKRYGSRWALQGVNLSLRPSEILGFVGPNGAGKTTLLKLVSGLVRPSCGEGVVDGQALSPSKRAAPHVGVMLEQPPFIEHKSGLRNLLLLASIRGCTSREDIRDAITLAGLDPDDKRPVKAYSQGMRQRLAFAQAIMERPRLLLLDEPSNGLDPRGIVQFREAIRAVAAGGTAVLLSSHLLAEVEAMCDKVILVEGGRILRQIDRERIGDASSGLVRIVFVNDDHAYRAVSVGYPVIEADGQALILRPGVSTPQLVRHFVEAGLGIEEVGPVRTRLEDVYLDMTTGEA